VTTEDYRTTGWLYDQRPINHYIFWLQHYNKYFYCILNKSSQSHLETQHCYQSWQTVHSSAACASCTMRNVMEHYGCVTERYGSITEPLQKVMEALWDVMECCRAIMEHCGVLQNITECCRTLWNIMGHYGILWKHYGSVTGCCGALQNITEPMWKISILPVTN